MLDDSSKISFPRVVLREPFSLVPDIVGSESYGAFITSLHDHVRHVRTSIPNEGCDWNLLTVLLDIAQSILMIPCNDGMSPVSNNCRL